MKEDELYAKAKRVFDESNLSPTETAIRLRCNFHWTPSEIAKALYSKEGLGQSVIQTTRAVIEVSHIGEAIDALLETGISYVEIAKALSDRYGLNFDDTTIVNTFFPHRISAMQLAGVLRDGCGYSNERISVALNSLYGCNLATESTAKTLRDGLGLTSEEIARTLKNGLLLKDSEVAKALGSPEGLGLAAEEVAWALTDGLCLSAPEIARAFYSKHGLALDTPQIAKVFHSEDGLDLDEFRVSVALRDGLELDAAGVARALWKGGWECSLWDVFGCITKCFDELHDKHMDSPTVSAVFRDAGILKAFEDISARAKELYAAYEENAADVATALKCTDGFEPCDIAKVLYSPDGLDLSIAATAWALSRGLALDSEEVVRALMIGLNMSQEEILPFYRDAGIGPDQSHAEKALSELQSNSESVNQGIK